MSGRYQEGYVAGHKKGMKDGGEMNDIVRRLRVETDRLYSEAADEIERLRAQWHDSDPEKFYLENKALRAEIEWLRAEKETRHQMIKTLIDADPRHDLAAENARLRAFAESVRNWKRFPLWELTDTDHERAAAFRRQLEIHAEAAREALEDK